MYLSKDGKAIVVKNFFFFGRNLFLIHCLGSTLTSTSTSSTSTSSTASTGTSTSTTSSAGTQVGGSHDANAPPGQPPMGFMIPGPLPPGALPGIPAGMPAGFMAIPSLPGADPFLPCQSRHLIGQRAQARANQAAGQVNFSYFDPFRRNNHGS